MISIRAIRGNSGLTNGIMTGLLELGAFLGAMQAGFLADKYSRKKTIGIGAIWFIVGSYVVAARIVAALG